MLDNVQRAAIELALKTLDENSEYKHRAAIIIQVAGEEAAEDVTELAKEYRDANAAAKANSGAMLSAEAADYWREAQGVLALGRRVKSIGSREGEKDLSRKCERLEESFSARVPLAEQGKFIQHHLEDGLGWDDRWHYTEDFAFPLLSPQFNDSLPVKNPVGEAQRVVLAALLTEREPDAQAINIKRLRSMFSEFRDEREAQVVKENLAIVRTGERHRKSAKRYAKKMEREAAKAARQSKKGARTSVPNSDTEPRADKEEGA